MKSPFITRARHEAEMAAKDAEIASLRQSNHSWKVNYRATMDVNAHFRAENAILRARLAKFDASNRRRDERGRYVGEKK